MSDEEDRVAEQLAAQLSVAAKHADEMTVDEKVQLITRNLQETLGVDTIRAVLNEKRPLNLYWGTAPTGKPHIGYLVPLSKIADFLKAGCKVKILLADLHAFLDNQKAPWELLRLRTEYYEHIIKATLCSIGVPIDLLEFVVGTSYQLSREYNLDAYRLAAVVTEHDAKKAGAEVVKQVDHPLLSGLIYPGLQALDEEYLGVDAQFGGTDQRKIFTYAEKYMPQLGYKKRAHLMNYMVPGLMGSKMSSSDPDSKIDLLDDAKTVERKIRKAFCEEGNIKENGLLSFAKFVLFPLYTLRGQSTFVIKRKLEHGGDLAFASYADLELQFAEKQLHPLDLKKGVADAINHILAPIRKHWQENPHLTNLTEKAYPVAPAASNGNATTSSETNGKGQAKGGKKAQQQQQASAEEIGKFDLRIGKILSVSQHPDADSLYVEKIDVGEKEPRTIVSGLVKYFRAEELLNRNVVVLANLKPSKLRGIASDGMVLAASSGDTVELLEPVLTGEDTVVPGTRVLVKGFDQSPPDAVVHAKLKFFDQVLAELKTNSERQACYKGILLKTADGNATTIQVKSLKDALIR